MFRDHLKHPMTKTCSSAPTSKYFLIFAVSVGAIVPSLIFGRVVLSVVAILAILMLFADGRFWPACQSLGKQFHTILGLLILGTVITWLPGAINSSFPARSIEAVLRTPIFLAIAYIIYATLKTNERILALTLKAFIFMSAVAACIALLSLTIWPELFWVLRLKGFQSTPLTNELKGFAALTLFIFPVLALSVFQIKDRWRILALATCAYLPILVWETYNRAAVAGFIVAIILFAITIFSRKNTKKQFLLFASALGLFLGLIIYWLKITRGRYGNAAPGDDWLMPVWLIDYQRQTIWKHVWDIAADAPWFGIGANTINFTPGADAVISGTHQLHIIPAHPHNWFFEVFAETGGVGTTALIVTILWAGIWLLRKYRKSGDLGYAAAIAIMGGYWGSGLFNFSYWSAWWQVAFYISVALCLAQTTAYSTSCRNEQSKAAD